MTADEAKAILLAAINEVWEGGYWVAGHWDDDFVCIIGPADADKSTTEISSAEVPRPERWR